MSYFQRPITIDAVQIGHAELTSEPGIIDGWWFDIVPDWLIQANKDGIVKLNRTWHTDYACWDIYDTNYYGDKIVSITLRPDDWIVRNPDGKIYGCRKELFDLLYCRNG